MGKLALSLVIVIFMVGACSKDPVYEEPTPESPIGVKAFLLNFNSIKVTWSPTSSYLETGYEIWRSAVGPDNYQRIASLNKNEREYVDNGISVGVDYYYKVKTLYENQEGKPSAPLMVFTGLWAGRYEGTTSSALKINPETGSVVGEFTIPGDWLEAWDGRCLWCSNGTTSIDAFNPINGQVTGGLAAAGLGITGLAYESGYLWEADTDSEAVYRVNIQTGGVVKSFYTPSSYPSGLAFDGLYLWNADMWGNKIYKLDVNTGYPVYEFGAPGTYPRGLSWDGEYLWCIATDTYNNEHIYKVTPEGAVTSEFAAPFDTYGLEIQH